jgi:TPR repeat protein
LKRRTRLFVLLAVAVAGVFWLDPQTFLSSREMSYERALAYQRHRIHDKADRHFRSACRHGHADGCLEAGDAAFTGTGRSRDVEDALWFFGKACDLGRGIGCTRMAKAFQPGGEGEPDAAKAAAFARRAEEAHTAECDRGESSGCFLLGRLLLRDQRRPDAVARFRSGCALGSTFSCLLAAQQYRTGTLVPDEPSVALALYEKACTELQSGPDCCAASAEYAAGLSVPKDEAAAARFLALSCDAGTLEACMRMWRTEPAASRRVRRAAERFLEACPMAASSSAACSERCALGAAVPAGGVQALQEEWDQLCAEEDSLACHGAGLLAQRRDVEGTRSIALLEAACSGGVATACIHATLSLDPTREGPRIMELYRKGCAAGSRVACGALSPLYQR